MQAMFGHFRLTTGVEAEHWQTAHTTARNRAIAQIKAPKTDSLCEGGPPRGFAPQKVGQI